LIGLSLRLSRIVLGLTQDQAGAVLGMGPTDRKLRIIRYEQAAVRPAYARLDKIVELVERAVVYAGEVHGAPGFTSRLPQANDPQYALKLFKYWQEHDGTRSGLRRLIPYLAPKNTVRRMHYPALPANNGRTLSTDEVELKVPQYVLDRAQARARGREDSDGG